MKALDQGRLIVSLLFLESFLLQVCGPSGARLNSKDPLPAIASREEVEATKNHILEAFYPISPTIDLQECNVYDVEDNTGKCHSLISPGSEEMRDALFPEERSILNTVCLAPHTHFS